MFQVKVLEESSLRWTSWPIVFQHFPWSDDTKYAGEILVYITHRIISPKFPFKFVNPLWHITLQVGDFLVDFYKSCIFIDYALLPFRHPPLYWTSCATVVVLYYGIQVIITMVPFQFIDSKYHLPPPTPFLLLKCDSTQWPPQDSLLGSWKKSNSFMKHYKSSSNQNDHDFVLCNMTAIFTYNSSTWI